MQQSQIIRIIRSGFIATLVMTVFMLMAPLMGMPKMLIGNSLAGFMHLPIAIGWIAHFMIGILIAAGYVLVFSNILSINRVVKGALYGLIPFLMAQIIVMPMMGAGVFSSNTPTPILMVMGSLLGHLVYGAILGLTAENSTIENTATA